MYPDNNKLKIQTMVIQDKLRKKGYNLVASYNNGERVGYYANSINYNEKTRTYKTQTEVWNVIKNK